MIGEGFITKGSFGQFSRNLDRRFTNLEMRSSSPSSAAPIPSGTYEPVIAVGAATDYWRGDKTWQSLTQNAVVDLTTADSPKFAGVRLGDTDLSHHLLFKWNEDLVADQTLNWIIGAADRTVTLIGNPTLSDWFDQDVKTTARSTFKGLTIGPETDNNQTFIKLSAYTDYPVNSNIIQAGEITAEGSGEPEHAEDDPTTRGTEFNMETPSWIPNASMGSSGVVLIHGGLIYTQSYVGGVHKLMAWDQTTGAAVRESADNALSNCYGICTDGTYIYTAGYHSHVPYSQRVQKHQISDLSLVGSWTDPDGAASLVGLAYFGGYLYALDSGSTIRKMHKLVAATMTLDSSLDCPEYTAGSKWLMGPFCIDPTGTYGFCGALRVSPAEEHNLKFQLSDMTIITDSGAVTADSLYFRVPCYYSEGTQARIYAAGASSLGYSNVGKWNPDTLLLYYGVVSTTDEALGCAADENYVYVSMWDSRGIDRRLKNDIWIADSTKGTVRLWSYHEGTVVEVANYDGDLNFTFKGPVISTLAIGTAPFQPTSTTVCPNLNADLWDSYQFADYLDQAVKMGSSPAFVTVKCSGLTDGYVPYHVSDAAGLANSPIITDGTNVGIGWTAPEAPLHVSGAGYSEYGYWQIIAQGAEAYNASPTAGVMFRNKYSSAGAVAGMGGILVAKENATDGEYGGYMALFTRANGGDLREQVRILSNGSVGIGATVTQILSRLTLAGNIILRNTDPADAGTNVSVGTICGQARSYGEDEGTGIAKISFMTDATSWYKGGIAFYTNNLDGTDPAFPPTEKMRITASGSVGIGTTSPLALFTVSKNWDGADYSQGQSFFNGVTDPLKYIMFGIDTTNNIGKIQAGRQGVSAYNIAINPEGGSVLIGATAAIGTEKLYVAGSAIVGADNGSAKLFVNDYGANIAYITAGDSDRDKAVGLTLQIRAADGGLVNALYAKADGDVEIPNGDLLVNGTKVVSNRVIDARCDDAINSGDVTTDGVIDALRDAMIAHGLIAAA